MNANVQRLVDILMQAYDMQDVEFFKGILSNPECARLHDLAQRMLSDCESVLSKRGVKQ